MVFELESAEHRESELTYLSMTPSTKWELFKYKYVCKDREDRAYIKLMIKANHLALD